jgi:putative ATPase
VIGQRHLLGAGQAAAPGLRVAAAAFDDPVGAAGRGQDHAGAADGRGFDAEFVALSAVFSGVKDIREAIQQAEAAMARAGGAPSCSWTRCIASTRRSRMPSCPMSSSGLVTFIGATTENPSFEVNSALLSRAAVYVLKSLDTEANWASCSSARWRSACPELASTTMRASA